MLIDGVGHAACPLVICYPAGNSQGVIAALEDRNVRLHIYLPSVVTSDASPVCIKFNHKSGGGVLVQHLAQTLYPPFHYVHYYIA